MNNKLPCYIIHGCYRVGKLEKIFQLEKKAIFSLTFPDCNISVILQPTNVDTFILNILRDIIIVFIFISNYQTSMFLEWRNNELTSFGSSALPPANWTVEGLRDLHTFPSSTPSPSFSFKKSSTKTKRYMHKYKRYYEILVCNNTLLKINYNIMVGCSE